jgi:Ca2+-binding RTX toxin-like protein
MANIEEILKMADIGTFSNIIDRVIRGTSNSETLRVYATQPIFDAGDNWSDIGFNTFGGNDLIIAAHGDDEIFSGSGNDRIKSFYGFNDVDGGTGDDTLDYSWFGDYTSINVTSGVSVNLTTGNAVARNAGIRFSDSIESVENVIGSDFNDRITGSSAANDLFGGFGSDYLSGGARADYLVGGAGNDSIYGGTGSDIIKGESGSDYISGGSGNDNINGSSGDDDIFGGLGADDMIGGSGVDYFVFATVDDSNTFIGVDLVKDFIDGVDKFDFHTIDANENLAGNQAFRFIGTADFTTGNAGRIRYDAFTSSNTTVIEVEVNGDRQADFTLDVTSLHDFIASDFIL